MPVAAHKQPSQMERVPRTKVGILWKCPRRLNEQARGIQDLPKVDESYPGLCTREKL